MAGSFVEVRRGQRRRRLVLVGVVVAVVAVVGTMLVAVLRWDDRPITEVRIATPHTLLVHGHCHHSARARLDESSNVIEITLQTRGGQRGDCMQAEHVVLEQPVGGRRIIDSTTGQTVIVCDAVDSSCSSPP